MKTENKVSEKSISASVDAEFESNQTGFLWFWILTYGLAVTYGVIHFLEKGSATFPLVIMVCLIFIHIYTESIELPPQDGADSRKKRVFDENCRKQRQKWMIFAYGFMLFSIMMTLYPFVISYGEGSEKNKHYLDTIRERPIALFIGYSLDKEIEREITFPEERQTNMSDVVDLAQQDGVKEDGLVADTRELRSRAIDGIKTEWVINIGGYVETCEPTSNINNGQTTVCAVRGGLLVPLYFIILALMGGSISLTRRLPELQKMANPSYVATENQPKLSQHEFREYLIFHIVQFISAPFLAVLAYYLIEPSSTANAVALAFTAGFTSESILLIIRSIAEKIAPKTTDAVQYGTITGVVTLGSADEMNRPAVRAVVSLADLPQVTTLTDEQGVYVLGNVPVGVNNLQITYGESVSKTDSVRVDNSRVVVKKNLKIDN